MHLKSFQTTIFPVRNLGLAHFPTNLLWFIHHIKKSTSCYCDVKTVFSQHTKVWNWIIPFGDDNNVKPERCLCFASRVLFTNTIQSIVWEMCKMEGKIIRWSV